MHVQSSCSDFGFSLLSAFIPFKKQYWLRKWASISQNLLEGLNMAIAFTAKVILVIFRLIIPHCYQKKKIMTTKG